MTNIKKTIFSCVILVVLLLCFIIFYNISYHQADAATSVDVQVDKSVKTTVLSDSDGDGIVDTDDPHPDVAEIYIVKDDNRNGVVDDFE